MARMEYLFILIFWLIVSSAIQHKYHIRLYNSVKQMAVSVGFFLLVGVAWDMIGATRGHWEFGYENLTGIRVGILPVEEVLFMLVVPYGILVFYRLFGMKIK